MDQQCQAPFHSLKRLPLTVRTAADVGVLRDSAAAVRRMPAGGITVSLTCVAPQEARKFELRLRAYIRACGCAEGAIAALLGMGALVSWCLVAVGHRGLRSSDVGLLLAAPVAGVLLGGLGKALGMVVARIRFVRCCNRIISRAV